MLLKQKPIILLMVVACMLLVAGCGGNSDFSDEMVLAIGTAGVQGIYYPIGAGVAEIINAHVPNVSASAEVTAGGVENITRIDKGEIHLGLANYDAAYFAEKGEAPFNKVMNASALFPTIASTTQIVTFEKSGINSLADLRGKKVSVGPAGSSINIMAINLLNAAGLTPGKDVKTSPLSNVEAAQSLKDGNIDAMILMTTYPMASITEVASSGKIKLLSIPEDVRDRLVNEHPYYVKTTMPANVYDNVNYEVETIALMTLVLASNSLDEEVAYQIVKAVYENLDQLKEVHDNMKNMTIEDAKDIPVSIHPGAERYFKERGII